MSKITSKELREVVTNYEPMGTIPTGLRPLPREDIERLADALEVLEFVEAGGVVRKCRHSIGNYFATDPNGREFYGTDFIEAVRAARDAGGRKT